MGGMTRPCILALLVASLPSGAAELFADDFESGALGSWQCGVCERPPNWVRASALAAHRGTYGFRLDDSENVSGADSGASASVALSPTSHLYGRAWVRVTQTNNQGDALLLDFINGLQNLNNVYLNFPSGTLVLAGSTKPATFVTLPTTGVLSDGEWHLVEAAVTGGGTLAGARTLWLDGRQLATETGLDWVGADWTPNQFVLGEAWSTQRTFVGIVDFDDVRLSDQPLASRIVVQPVASPVARTCIPFTAELRDSVSNTVAQAPYALTLNVTGPTALFANEDCSQPLATPTMTKGATVTTFFGRFDSSGVVTMAVSHVDFLSSDVPLDILPAGAGDRGLYAISCAQVPAELLAVELTLLLMLSVRTSSRPRGRTAAQSRRSLPSSTHSDRTA
jgi:hypothetical protein